MTEVVPHPTRLGWFGQYMPDGSFVGWEGDAQPSIKWKHIDGPMLLMRNGEICWLTWRERFRCWMGWEDAYSLERKRRPHLAAHGDQQGRDESK